MSKYIELKRNQPKLTVKKDAREVIFTTVSCMCDNIHYITFKKNADGDFKMAFAMRVARELVWAAVDTERFTGSRLMMRVASLRVMGIGRMTDLRKRRP
jgi:hypothetical protein